MRFDCPSGSSALPRLSSVVRSIRSKNAGPFTATLDIFCDSREAFERVCRQVDSASLSAVLRIRSEEISRFTLPDLRVVKLSFRRPAIQGALNDRDMHCAQLAHLVGEIEID